MNKEALKRVINEKVRVIENALDRLMPGTEEFPPSIHEAMRYSLFAGGKRLRPVLFLAAAEAVGGDSEKLLPSACAQEMIHTYSLIHDDLPAMDNDDFRRGKPTSHKVFGEAMAVLAGDALLTRAFELIAENGLSGGVSPQTTLQVIRETAVAAGSMGMIGGQVVDIESEDRQIDRDTLAYIHNHKTGALFRAALRSGALMGGGAAKEVAALTEFAENLGLAFQITDDILDVEGETEVLGKTAGSDERKKKATYPSIYGLDISKQHAARYVEKSVRALEIFDEKAGILRYIAGYLLERSS